MPHVTTTATPATDIYYVDAGQGQPIVCPHACFTFHNALYETRSHPKVKTGILAIFGTMGELESQPKQN